MRSLEWCVKGDMKWWMRDLYKSMMRLSQEGNAGAESAEHEAGLEEEAGSTTGSNSRRS